MSRYNTSTATSPATAAATYNNLKINTANTARKPSSDTMDKLFSIVNPAAAVAAAAAQHDDNNPYILPSFADNYEAWAYPETQQAVFEDWITNASTPPPAAPALSSVPSSVRFASASASPTLSPPSANLSASSSPLLSNDIALSLVSTLQSPSGLVSQPQSQRSVMPSTPACSQPSLSVADYAAALFPDLAGTLSSSLVTSAAALSSEPSTIAHTPCAARSPVAGAPLDWTADIAGLLETAIAATTPASPASEERPAAGVSANTASLLLDPSPDVELDESRKRRDTEFLASLPPQLALKRRRTSNMKQKEKILAELLSTDSAASPAAISSTASPAIKKASPAAKKASKSAPADASADATSEDGSLDAAALKRRKNTDAARRSRMRKILRIETLEGRVTDLESENSRLLQLVAKLEAEKAAAAQRLKQYEAQLTATPSHFAL
ncbi:hypothetical protein GGI12_003255 [Dipsacomyces acuminosporus]|nr:hypothetical protein GGI12_003255 [Dipsacomyces acuminosporus]